MKAAKRSCGGYPRSKGDARFDSVEWPQSGDGARWLPKQRRVYLQGIGQVKADLHRQVAGRVKTIQIKRQGRRWMLVPSCDDVPTKPLPVTRRQAGIDVGIVSIATTSDGERIDNPRWARAGSRSGWPQPSSEFDGPAVVGGKVAAERRTVAARYRKIANQRKDFHHKQARELAAPIRPDRRGGLDRIADMLRRAKPVPDPANPGHYLPNGARAKSGLNRSISDAGWGQFISILRAKAGRGWAALD